ISGSSPDAEVVTRSTGIGWLPFAARSASTSAVTRSIKVLLVGPRFEPPDAIPSYPSPAADGRPEKYRGSENACPISVDPSVRPSTVIRDPFAWPGKRPCATTVMSAGYATPVTTVSARRTPSAGRSRRHSGYTTGPRDPYRPYHDDD